MIQFVKEFIKNTQTLYNWAMYVFYTRQFKRYLKLNNIPNKHFDGEDEYKRKWSAFGVRVEPYSYRLFSQYFKMGGDDIVPENIGRCYIETVLNPSRMRTVYEDKNMFPILCGKAALPETVVCRMGGGPILDCEYNPIIKSLDNYLEGYSKVILKPSLDSCSGHGVMLFENNGSYWEAKNDGRLLTTEFLLDYGDDFVLQEAVQQHPDIARFNPSSVNTLRIAVYRSVIDNEPHAVASVIRIGKEGMFVDNAHAGGLLCGINILTGKLDNILLDQYGNRYETLNGIDYQNNEYFIPQWERVKGFVCDIARKLVHHRFIAFDVTVDIHGEVRLIEYNISGFGYWVFMFTGQKCFGEYTDEVIEYCVNRKK